MVGVCDGLADNEPATGAYHAGKLLKRGFAIGYFAEACDQIGAVKPFVGVGELAAVSDGRANVREARSGRPRQGLLKQRMTDVQ